MPIYDFRCRECGKISEVWVRSSEGSVARCPDCGSESLEKLISASYMIRMGVPESGTACCGRAERCEMPPCSSKESCHRK